MPLAIAYQLIADRQLLIIKSYSQSAIRVRTLNIAEALTLVISSPAPGTRNDS
ncbi:hypothetical protein K9N68_34670 (plasmid) [Kovacikia minuta CCNUW1]|uniref:hypothetical protein n=1 Tax=Kovacikia minuta TaxID=2931930 RepID=UPI001CCA2949|nr:hypothetical protein [Kovacikia minuta]UBF30351.1 hypothetical protein K9N68_34670 [Kovacikia minuta CCNUW1]